MGDVQRLVSAVLAHAGRQHEESKWAIVTETMTRETIAGVLRVAEARTPRQAVRAMQRHLDMLTLAYGLRELTPAA